MEIFNICCIGLLFLTTVVAEHCTDEEVDNCYDNFTPIETSIDDSVIIRPFSEDDIRLHCSEYEQAKACIQDFDEHCHVVDRLLFNGRDSAYDWLCEEAMQEYIDHSACWGQRTLHDEGDRCNATLSSDLDSVPTNRGASHYFRKICLYANHYLDCIENSVESECDADAAAWHREFDTRLLHPLLQATGCRLSEDGAVYYPDTGDDKQDDGVSTITYIIVGCIIAITLILATVLILMMLHIRQKRHKQRSRARQAGGAPYVYYNNGAHPSASAVYPGGAHAGPLPTKGPEPPAYDPLPPPSYSTDPAAHAKAHSVAGSTRTSPPDYASQAGSVRAPSERSFPDDAQYRGATSMHSYVDIDPSDVKSVKSHRSSRSHQRY